MRELNVIFFFFLIFLFACSGSDKKKSNKENLGVEITASDMEKGGQLYRAKCMNCHLKTGKGIPKVFPPLANSDYLNADVKRAISAVVHGLTGEITVNGEKYNSVMTRQSLSDEEVADVLTYVYNSWGNNKTNVTKNQVLEVKSSH